MTKSATLGPTVGKTALTSSPSGHKVAVPLGLDRQRGPRQARSAARMVGNMRERGENGEGSMNHRRTAAVIGAVAGLGGVAHVAAQSKLQDKFFGDDSVTNVASA